MLKRTVVGILGSFLVCVAIFFNQSYPIILNILIAIASVISMYELLSAMGVLKKYFLTIPTFLFTVIVPLFITELRFQFFWYVYTLIIFFVTLISKNITDFKDTAIVYTMALVVSLSLGSLIMIRDISGKFATFYVVLTLAVAWTSDTGAYFCGSFFGKHKLCPIISPKKTVEGAIGGIIVSFVSAFLVCFVFKNYIFDSDVLINYYLVALVGFLGPIISMIGDLSFSFVKRTCNVKDFGNVIPGHGGVLDRIDSVIFLSPFVCFLSMLFPLVKTIY